MAELGTRFVVTVTVAVAVAVVVVIVAVTVYAVLTTVCSALRCSARCSTTQQGDQILCRITCSAQVLLLRNSPRLGGSVSAVAVVGRVVVVVVAVVVVAVVTVIVHMNRSAVYCRGESSGLLCTASTATATATVTVTVTVHAALRSIRMSHSSPDPLPLTLSLALAVAVSAVSVTHRVWTIPRARVRALVPAQHVIVVVSRLVAA
jgi:hypothetical protein